MDQSICNHQNSSLQLLDILLLMLYVPLCYLWLQTAKIWAELLSNKKNVICSTHQECVLISNFSNDIPHTNSEKKISLTHSLTLTHTHARARAHTHTHTQIYIYFFLRFLLLLAPSILYSKWMTPLCHSCYIIYRLKEWDGWNIQHAWVRKNEHKILVRKLVHKRPLWRPGFRMNIIMHLKKKQGRRVRSGFPWLQMGSSGSL
jgi:hypothetical protein